MNNLIELSKNVSHPIHSVHPYFAKFPSSIPNKYISEYSSVGDTVLDPFCGSGTTPVEATLLGRNAIGVDANPLACFIARVKSTPITGRQLKKTTALLREIESDIDAYHEINSLFSNKKVKINYKIPEFHNRDYWFSKSSLNELAIIKAHLMKINDVLLRDFFLLCFSRIIVFSSNQQTESRYKSVDKKRKPKDVFNQFNKIVISLQQVFEDYSQKRSDVNVEIYNSDSRSINFIKSKTVDLVVTSPPYLNSWDYALYHRFRFFWLDMSIQNFENMEIGKHLRALEGRSKADEVERYRIDMGLCLSEAGRVLKRNKHCVIVNANSIVKKKFIDTSKMIVSEAEKHGFKFIDVLDRQVFGPHYGMHASLNAKNIMVEDEHVREEQGNIAKKEQILILKKL